MTQPPSTAALPFSLPTTSDGGGLTAYISSLGDNPYFGAGAGRFELCTSRVLTSRTNHYTNYTFRSIRHWHGCIGGETVVGGAEFVGEKTTYGIAGD